MLAVAPVVASALTVLRARLLEIFPPASLGLNSVSILWFDPSDLGSMFQDVEATTPVTAPEQPVALWLDKGKGVGPNLITNSTFDNDVDDWEANQPATILSHGEDGTLVFTRTEPTGAGGVVHYFPTVAGRYYRLTATLVSSTNLEDQGVMLRGGSVIEPIYHTFDAPGTASGVFKATGSSSVIYLRGTLGVNTWDNAEAREILGNHATQSVAPKRPTYQAGEGLHWLAFDGVDDFLSADAHPFSFTGGVTFAVGYQKIGNSNAYETFLAAGATGYSTSNLANTLAFQHARAPGGQISTTANLATDVWTPSGVKATVPLASGINHVATWNIANWSTHKISGSEIRLDGVSSDIVAYGTNNPTQLLAGPLFIGVYDPLVLASSFYKGRMYGLVARNTQSTLEEITSIEKYLAGKTGVTL
jgi:hypothetical protein